MKLKRRLIYGAILLGICVLIHIFSLKEDRVEEVYSNGIFITISRFLRTIFGWIPFSIGDILYGIAFIWIIYKLIAIIRNRKGPKTDPYRKRISHKLLGFFILIAWLYILFNVLWGINYNRIGIASQLGLKMDKYTALELQEMNCLLVDKVNNTKKNLLATKERYPSDKQLFSMVNHAYQKISETYPFLRYQTPSLKHGMWGWLGNYAGFTGYYNPFTGEAQVNTTVPAFVQPFVACHEVAHQIGYAKEMEANFVGYLAAAASDEPLMQYSVYLDLFLYTNRNLARTDTISAKLYRKDLDSLVIADLEEWRRFSRKHRSPAEPFIRWVYGVFLQSNQQPQGILSYDEVTAFIIAYYKKFRKI